MATLAEKIKSSRCFDVPVGRFVFVVERPPQLEWHALRGDMQVSSFFRYLRGWKNVTYEDLFSGGGPGDAPFDLDAATAWLIDRSNESIEICKAIADSIKTHSDKVAAAEKN